MRITSNYQKNTKAGLHLHNEIRPDRGTYFASEFPEAGALIQVKGEKSIIIEGVAKKWKRGQDGPQLVPFKKVFKIGDTVKTGSYNLIYTGVITKIGPKSVTTDDAGEIKRFDLVEFIRNNWDLDLEKIRRKNIDTSYYI